MLKIRHTNTGKYFKKSAAAIFAVVMILMCGIIQPVSAVSQIYIAGAPECQPLEYYNPAEGVYEGILPELTELIAAKSGVSIEYMEPQRKDKRIYYAKNLQADAVWTVGLTGEELAKAGLKEGKIRFTYTSDGKEKTAVLAYTKTMGAAEISKLENAYASVTPQQIQGITVKEAEKNLMIDMTGTFVWYTALALIVILIAVITVLLFKQKKKKKTITVLEDVDPVTGGDSFDSWEKKYLEYVVDENRVHYAMIYISGSLEKIAGIYGFDEADDILRIVHDTLMEHLDSKSEACARFNGYKYVAFMKYTSRQQLTETVMQIHETIVEKVDAREQSYHMELYTGIYPLESGDKHYMPPVQKSGVAMAYAHSNLKEYAFYNDKVERQTAVNYAMGHEVVAGLKRGEFEIYLQPIVDIMNDDRICGAIALARWNNPDRGLLHPQDFLHILKKKHLIGKMNMEIFHQGCKLMYEHQKKGQPIRMLFSFTIENIGDNQFAGLLNAIATQYGVEKSNIIIQLNHMKEISESDAFPGIVTKLRNYGFAVCLERIEIDKVFFDCIENGITSVKIPQDIICNIEKDEGKHVVKSLVRLSRDLKLDVLTVGVDSDEQESYMHELGCRFVSGYRYYHPMNKKVFSDLLDGQEKGLK